MRQPIKVFVQDGGGKANELLLPASLKTEDGNIVGNIRYSNNKVQMFCENENTNISIDNLSINLKSSENFTARATDKIDLYGGDNLITLDTEIGVHIGGSEKIYLISGNTSLTINNSGITSSVPNLSGDDKDLISVVNKLQSKKVDIATTTTTGAVKPDGSTITITADGTISAVTGSSNILETPVTFHEKETDNNLFLTSDGGGFYFDTDEASAEKSISFGTKYQFDDFVVDARQIKLHSEYTLEINGWQIEIVNE